MNDLLHYAMREAVRLYGDRGDNLFTGAALSTVLSRITGSKACVDGRLIAALLVGRCDVQPLTGGSHYRCIEATLAVIGPGAWKRITFTPEPDTEFSRAQVKIKLPDAPPYVSTGIVCQTEHGHRVFVQRGGSKKDDPRQQVPCTDDGRTVDPVTGEILEYAAL